MVSTIGSEMKATAHNPIRPRSQQTAEEPSPMIRIDRFNFAPASILIG